MQLSRDAARGAVCAVVIVAANVGCGDARSRAGDAGAGEGGIARSPVQAMEELDAGSSQADAGSASDPECEQLCAVIEALDCSFGGDEDCQPTCAQSHNGPCGELVRAMDVCLLAAERGWYCLETVKIDRDQCPDEIRAVEECAHPVEDDAGEPPGPPPDRDLDAGAAPDAAPADAMSVLPDDAGLPNDAGHASDATGDANEGGASDAAAQAPDVAVAPSCLAYCAGQQLVACEAKPTQADCRTACEADEAGPCGPQAGALHACVGAAERPWVCIEQVQVGLPDNVCVNEALDFLSCLSTL